jgi:acyl-CoA synthetase (AMP-forming)/AMP-acid ligase II
MTVDGNMSLASILAPGPRESKVHFIDERREVTLSELWKSGESVAAWRNRIDDQSVAMVLSNSLACATVLLGSIKCGLNLVSIPTPPRSTDLDWYVAFVKSSCSQLRVHHLVVDARYIPLLPPIDGIEYVSYEWILSLRGEPCSESDGFELVQFSSGSTGDPKGVVLPGSRIAANICDILQRLDPSRGDSSCSWLPLSHDMGLIGMFLSAIAGGGPDWANGGHMVMMTPEGFLRNPMSWLHACSEFKCTITASPNFGFEMAERRFGGSPLDLSRLRVCITGAEPIRPEGLRHFAEIFEPTGFKSRAFSPAYGLAESTLAVTLVEPAQHWHSLRVDPTALACGEFALADEGMEFVSSGPRVRGAQIHVGDRDGVIEEIHVGGASMGTKYSNGSPLMDPDGWFNSGDSGMVIEGELFVFGRIDDVLVIAGKKLYAGDVERHVDGLEFVRTGRVVAVADSLGQLAVVCELASDPPGKRSCRSIAAEIRRRVSSRSGVAPRTVAVLAKGGLPMTASGKPRRAVVTNSLAAGELEALPGSFCGIR